jgi:2-polyprenyl-6-methoxyphenol hydroxylase-like FAD-dependent oxidoreductase
MPEPKVLIVGAGPTGLVLATWLTKKNIPFRIIEKNDGPGQASRAMAVQARTLEFYRQLGFVDQVLERGIQVARGHLRKGKKELANFSFRNFGEGLSPFPFVLSFPQDEHEKLLVNLLSEAGIQVEWSTELTGFVCSQDSVQAALRSKSGAENCTVEYICGCDGAHSTVRETLKFGFPGGTYERLFYVADVHLTSGPQNEDINFCLGPDFLLIVFPIRTSGQHRLIGIVPDVGKDPQQITFDDVRPSAEQLADVRVDKVNWFSTYKVHHRVADHFRSGRAFIAGDAGHIHSPAGGQGMNTGIGDAVNLAWKLASVVSGRASAAVLDSYEAERITFARDLVSTTDRVFQTISGRSVTAQFVRAFLMPYVFPLAFQVRPIRVELYRIASQIRIEYRQSPLSRSSAGKIHGGDRLPWAPASGGSNFDVLRSLDWQLHIYGAATPALQNCAKKLNLPLYEFTWSDQAERAGLQKNASYLVRPDGYIALADSAQDPAELERYFDEFKISLA